MDGLLWTYFVFFAGFWAGVAVVVANRESRHQIYLEEDLKVRRALREIDNLGRPQHKGFTP